MRALSIAALAAASATLRDFNDRPGVRVLSLRMDAGTLKIEALEAKAEKITTDVAKILDDAEAAGREVTDEEQSKVDELLAQRDKLDKQIAARVKISPQSAGRRTREQRAGDDRVPAEPRADAGKGGYRNLGEFAMEVRGATLNPGQAGQRIMAAAPSTASGENTGADGGFAVPPDFRADIWEKITGQGALMERADQLVTGGNTLQIPADETTPWQTTGGIQAAWENELAAMSQSKVSLEPKFIRLNKLTCLVPVGEELLQDAPGLDSYLRRKAPLKMRAKLNTAIIRGTGAGQPLGILNSPSRITVAAVSAQGAGTVVYKNIVDMWARLWGDLRADAVWLINQDVEPQLDTMAFDPAATSKVPVYLPAGGVSASGFATLKGRPVIPVMPCSTVGTEGDIILTSLSQYMIVTKGQDIQSDVSMHLFFDAAALAYRFIFRVAGQPWWARAITPENGTNTLSWAVTLNSTRT